MKNLKFTLVMMLFLAVSFTAFALQSGAPELGDPTSLVQWLSPVIVWAATALSRLGFKIPSWAIVSIVVPLLSFAITYFTTGLGEESNWFMQFVYTLSATFIQEVKKKLTPAPTT